MTDKAAAADPRTKFLKELLKFENKIRIEKETYIRWEERLIRLFRQLGVDLCEDRCAECLEEIVQARRALHQMSEHSLYRLHEFKLCVVAVKSPLADADGFITDAVTDWCNQRCGTAWYADASNRAAFLTEADARAFAAEFGQ